MDFDHYYPHLTPLDMGYNYVFDVVNLGAGCSLLKFLSMGIDILSFVFFSVKFPKKSYS